VLLKRLFDLFAALQDPQVGGRLVGAARDARQNVDDVLVANPEIDLTIDGRRMPYLARTADPSEKAELWQRITKRARNYEGYQRNTTRDIPVVICTPRPAQ